MGNKGLSGDYVHGTETGTANSDAIAIIPGPGSSNQTVELSIECRDLRDKNVTSTMDPFVVVFLLRGASWIEVTRTEIIENSSYPVFDSIIARFNIQENQRLRFVVFDACNDMGDRDLSQRRLVGTMETTVGAVVRGTAYYESPLAEPSGAQRGMIYVSGEVENDAAPSVDVCMTMRCDKIESQSMFGSTNTFIRVSKLHPTGHQLHWMSIQKTKNATGATPQYNELRMPLNRLANSDRTRNLKFELFAFQSNGKHTYLCETIMTLERLAQMVAEGRGALGIPMGNTQNVTKKVDTTLHFDSFQTYRVPSLREYLSGGMEFAFSIAIDFTGSNGESSSIFGSKTSDPHKKKHLAADLYLDAISSVGGVMTAYDHDGMFPAYGFQGDRCFALNGSEGNPRVHGLVGIRDIFIQVLRNAPLKGPTCFEPIVLKGMLLANAASPDGINRYVVLIVLTDGKFSDKQKTIDAVVQAAQLPLSIMFVGVGDDPDGKDMKAIDDLIKACNAKASREMVQFVSMKSLDDLEPAAKNYVWARQMVMKIPSQMISYYWQRNVWPTTSGITYGPVPLVSIDLPPPPVALPELSQAFMPPPPRP